jgi:hypothetical protein
MRCLGNLSGGIEGNLRITSIFTDSNCVPPRYSSAMLPLQQPVQLHTVPIRKVIKNAVCLTIHITNPFT